MSYRSDRGAGLIGTIGGVTVFLTLLTFAVQLLFNLYAASVVTAVAYDSATMAAHVLVEDQGNTLAQLQEQAEALGRAELGAYGERASFNWDVNDERVRLTIGVDHPKIALEKIIGVFGLNRVERSVEVRLERPR